MATTDPDEFIREHGADAMREVIDSAIPMRAKLLHDVLVRGECPERELLSRAWRTTERGLLEAAGAILALVAMMRTGERDDVDHRSADLQRAVIALAARGALPVGRLGIPDDAFTGAPRLFAWWCASRACRALGKRATFFHARYVLVTAPRPELPRPPPICKADIATFREAHGLEATEEWLLSMARGEPGSMAHLWRETESELDAAEAVPVPRDALALLLADQRARRTRTYLQPVIAGLDGEPVIDTAARLRAAADIYDGKDR
ncbi:MAG: hypothetical protein VW547_10190 [Alphaproteobacteria bacterium]